MDHRDLVFLMVDVDFFKEVNDLHGHPAGDRLLQLVAERLSKVVRKSDVLVRWGGEEFLIMSRSADPSGTPAFCDSISDVMAGEPFDLGHGILVRKTCSVGWAPFPGAGAPMRPFAWKRRLNWRILRSTERKPEEKSRDWNLARGRFMGTAAQNFSP